VSELVCGCWLAVWKEQPRLKIPKGPEIGGAPSYRTVISLIVVVGERVGEKRSEGRTTTAIITRVWFLLLLLLFLLLGVIIIAGKRVGGTEIGHQLNKSPLH